MDERPFHQTNGLTLSLCGDVMTGRGIDQVLPHPSPPRLYEPYVTDARRYVELAQRKNGPFEVPLAFDELWGDALSVWEKAAPDLRFINLETSITQSDDYWPDKDIHYRMNPKNLPCLQAASLHCCCLANNHVLDWGYAGLRETLETLQRGKIKTAGAGLTQQEAEAPATFEVEGKGRVLIFSMASVSSGIPWDWAATPDKPGINLLPDLQANTAEHLAQQIQLFKRPGDLAIASIHWGGNWGYNIPHSQREFAHQLLDRAGFDLIYGHSSHHVKGIEVYRGKLILYGCGDFLDDYEGIEGYESYRDDLGLIYLADLELGTGKLVSLRLVPMQIRQFRPFRASRPDAQWLRDVLNREGSPWGTCAELTSSGTLTLKWQ
jgi:poly-gamma-glutamate synthesis protein (capsule biosynthesis protein)